MTGSNAYVRVVTDVESVAEIADSVERYGHRYARRLFTADEIATAGSVTSAASQRLAARFAAKEAVLKLLSPPKRSRPGVCIEIRTADNGAPMVQLSVEAATLPRELGIDGIALSMTHGAGIAAATAVALATNEGGHDDE